MLLSDYLISMKPGRLEQTALFLNQIEGWMRLSRTNAAQLCALNPASVTALSNELLAGGLIRECGQALTASGRKPTYLEMEPSAGLSAVLCLFRGQSRLTLHNLHHAIVASTTLPALSQATDARAVHEGCLAFLAGFQALEKGLLGLCVLIGEDYPHGPCLPEDLALGIEAALSVPIYRNHAVNMSCLSEGHLHYPEAHASVVCLSVMYYEVHVGVLAGGTHLFSHFQCGRLGILLDPYANTPQALKEQVALHSITAAAMRYLMSHPHAAFDAKALLTDEQPHRRICQLAAQGNPAALELAQAYARSLSMVLYNTACQYVPSLLVLQGEVLAILDLLSPWMQAHLDALFGQHTHRPKIIASQLGIIAPLYGASRFVLRQTLNARRDEP